MKKPVLGLLCIAALTSAAFAGTETYSGKEMKQVAPPPCPQWYADNEFNVGLWGTYVFTGNNWQDDRYIESDHAFGGGIDLKYFFHRYFGVGIDLIVRTACARDEEGAGQRTGVGDDPRIAAIVVGHDVRRQCRGAPRDDDAADREEIEDRAGRIHRDVDRAAGQEPALAPGTGEVLDAMRRQPVVARDLAEPVQHAQVLAGPEHHALVRIGSRSQVRDRRR